MEVLMGVNSLLLIYQHQQQMLIERGDSLCNVKYNIPQGKLNPNWVWEGEWNKWNKESFTI